MRSSLFATVLLTASQASALVRSPKPAGPTNGQYIVDGQFSFTNRAIFNFAGATSLPSGLYRSTYSVGTHVYQAANAVVSGGYLNLKVPGGQTAQPYRSAEVVTVVNNIKYASVRTVAIFSGPAGVCNGIFYYKNDTQETDIEWLSDAASLSNGGTRKLWFTNQDADQNGIKTYNAVTPPSDATTAEHEYRLDWTPGLVRWFVDGVQIWNTTSDVPNSAGPWVFNNWSNGDNGWSAGPPATEANFKIKDIEIYYNTCSGSGC
ncbi:glycoside hydrolase family 16 protein [Colletotrichum truncatum]|uniref:Glycoside hydrolase family 16 protein n=1 Tax=Colletotrichum truncatum TaxID=5467 RepID=A0ACC3ZB82_COLTU|nr:glycoside hydrolase family 16 protein [Colletotrichum truncatum]KAF6787734.1 glycoside hydrolase family 16 protein [Colletotrichum truncatum]